MDLGAKNKIFQKSFILFKLFFNFSILIVFSNFGPRQFHVELSNLKRSNLTFQLHVFAVTLRYRRYRNGCRTSDLKKNDIFGSYR